jgi:transcriptional regulator of arginine metabolism
VSAAAVVGAAAVVSGSLPGEACIFCGRLVYSMHACMEGAAPSPAWAGVVETGVLRDVIARPPMSKTERQRLIQTVVQQREVATQRELVSALSALGCEVTQATVSRDIRELDLQKVRTHLGRAKYVLSSRERPKDPEQSARHVLHDFARSTAVSQQLVVVRCEIGTANTVARQIDNLNHSDIIGTLAGDDTFVVIVGDSEAAQSVKRYLDRLREA